MSVLDRILAARRAGDLDAFADLVPYARFLGLRFERAEDGLVVRMPFSEHLVGNRFIPALHGGAIGSVLESAAILEALWRHDVVRVPKTINLTVDYLRPGRPVTTFARARITKLGRRVANLHCEAWQEGSDKRVATALVHLLLKPATMGE